VQETGVVPGLGHGGVRCGSFKGVRHDMRRITNFSLLFYTHSMRFCKGLRALRSAGHRIVWNFECGPGEFGTLNVVGTWQQ